MERENLQLETEVKRLERENKGLHLIIDDTENKMQEIIKQQNQNLLAIINTLYSEKEFNETLLDKAFNNLGLTNEWLTQIKEQLKKSKEVETTDLEPEHTARRKK